MGSVPIHKPKLFLISLLVEFLGLIALLFTKTDHNKYKVVKGVYFCIVINKNVKRGTYTPDFKAKAKTL